METNNGFEEEILKEIRLVPDEELPDLNKAVKAIIQTKTNHKQPANTDLLSVLGSFKGKIASSQEYMQNKLQEKQFEDR